MPDHYDRASRGEACLARQILMINRYTRPEMGRIFSEQNKFDQWLAVELAAAEALAESGEVPRGSGPRAARPCRIRHRPH